MPGAPTRVTAWRLVGVTLNGGRDNSHRIAYASRLVQHQDTGSAMSKELLWLTLTVILTGLMWVPYILDRIMMRGMMGAMANPSRNDKPQSAWAQRLYFAHTNAVENLIIFALPGADPRRARPFD